MSSEPRRDGDSAALPVRGLHRADDDLARKIREASHRLVGDGRAEPRQDRERAS